MKKSWKLTQKILSGEKTVETRWYKHRVKPWGCIKAGETIYFKDSGEPITIKAKISQVMQYEIKDDIDMNEIFKTFTRSELGVTEITKEINEYTKGKKYLIAVRIKDVQKIQPFDIDKSGFGLMSAWLCLDELKIKEKTKETT